MSTLQELATYVAQHTAVLPGVLAFSMGARSSLKAYLAAQAVEDPPKVEEEDLRRLKRCHRVFAYTFLLAILGTEFWLISQNNEKALDVFFRIFLGIAYQAAFFGTLVDITKAFSWAVFRSPGRMLHFRPARGTVSFPRVLVSFAVATALNLGTYFNVSSSMGSILVLALLYRAVSQAHRRTFSIRVVSLAMLAWLALTFILSGAVIMYLIKTYQEAPNGDLLDDDGNVVMPARPDEVSFASPAVMNYLNLLSPFIYALVPGILIAGAYRFDYANHVEENPAAASAVTLETIEPRARFARILSKGVILPSHAPSNFYKPYYATALRAWVLAQAATFAMFAAGIPLDDDVFKTSAFDLLGLSLAIPFMIVGLAITATVRGEFRRLWTYREVWTPKEGEAAEGGVVLAGNEEEQLPSYEAPLASVAADEKAPLLESVEVEAAPAYQVDNHTDSKA
ncbi:hypothetical protein JCM11251_006107 [Rhodosporidiobolus azoricus]